MLTSHPIKSTSREGNESWETAETADAAAATIAAIGVFLFLVANGDLLPERPERLVLKSIIWSVLFGIPALLWRNGRIQIAVLVLLAAIFEVHVIAGGIAFALLAFSRLLFWALPKDPFPADQGSAFVAPIAIQRPKCDGGSRPPVRKADPGTLNVETANSLGDRQLLAGSPASVRDSGSTTKPSTDTSRIEIAMLTDTQRKIVWGGLLCLVLLVFVVPWEYSLKTTSVERHDSAGYSFIFYPPTPRLHTEGVKVDLSRVILPMVVVVLATIAGVFLTGRKA